MLIKIIFLIILTCLAFYIACLLFLYFSQTSLVYNPNQKDFFDCDTFSKEEKKSYKTTRFYERKGEKPWIIVFFHGNGWRACDRQKITSTFEKTGYSYILVEYSGYAEGNKKIKPDIKTILQNVDDIAEYIKESWYTTVISAWRSLWTWPASYLAWKMPTDKLLLISPYSQLYKVAAFRYPIFPIKQLLTQNYNSVEYLKYYQWASLVVHWDRDKIINQKFWKELFTSIISKEKEFLDVAWWDHHNELYIEWVEEKILTFLLN